MIVFLQHQSHKYPPRTYENASADATIAFAFDFNTAGEKLTEDAVKSQGKIYIPVNPRCITNSERRRYNELLFSNKVATINIAGNGLYATIKHGSTQKNCDEIVFQYLESVIPPGITLIRSGGQSGFDEAGLKAAVKLGIPALCLCPKGWKYIDQDYNHIANEQKFKERFKGCIIL